MEIINANTANIIEIIDLLNECKSDMLSNDIFQWYWDYPNESIVIQDISRMELYMLTDNQQILGAITLNEKQEREYQDINWQDKEGKVLVIHRLAIHPKHKGKKFAQMLMDFAENWALERGYTSIRLDAYAGNPTALHIYDKRNYSKRGQVNFTGRVLPFFCYEKRLIKN